MTKYYDQRVKLKRFELEDLVLRKVSQATKDLAQGKLGPTWKGPYKITNYSRRESYNLESMDWKPLPCPWNIEHLKRYHQ